MIRRRWTSHPETRHAIDAPRHRGEHPADALSRRAFVVNAGAGTVDAIDLRRPAEPTLVRAIDVAAACGLPPGSAPNSVAAKFGFVAVAV